MEAFMANALNDSRATYSGGLKGFLLGAVAGALLATIVSVIFAMLDAGEGGPGLHLMAGAGLGGLAGLMWGALAARRRIT
jgi:hypothetical protein